MHEKQLSPRFLTYAELQELGYTVDDIVEKTVALSADDISGYDSQDNESQYWLEHRRNNMSLFVCAMQGDTMLGHFSAMRVKTDEAMAFLEGKCAETEFTVVSEKDFTDALVPLIALGLICGGFHRRRRTASALIVERGLFKLDADQCLG